MTVGTRCDGCFGMIDLSIHGAYLEMDVMTKTLDGDFDIFDSRHFHGHDCLLSWADRDEKFDGAFGDVEEILKQEGS